MLQLLLMMGFPMPIALQTAIGAMEEGAGPGPDEEIACQDGYVFLNPGRAHVRTHHNGGQLAGGAGRVPARRRKHERHARRLARGALVRQGRQPLRSRAVHVRRPHRVDHLLPRSAALPGGRHRWQSSGIAPSPPGSPPWRRFLSVNRGIFLFAHRTRLESIRLGYCAKFSYDIFILSC